MEKVNESTKQFNKLPVQYNKKDYKQVLDANRIVPMCTCHKPCVMKITKAMQKFDAVAKLRKESNKARAVGGIKKGEAKKGDKAKK